MLVTTLVHLGARFDVVTLDLREVDLDLVPAHTLSELRQTVPDVLAATNAGIFHTPEQPVGWWVVGGEERVPLNLEGGFGNFFLRPNGAFWIDASGAHVAESGQVAPDGSVWLATQSGPALVLDGALHPSFDPTSTSLKIRNAVGVVDADTVVLVKSVDPVRFHDLATLLRDRLGAEDALYLDGTISGLWADGLPGGGSGPPDEGYAGFLVVRSAAEAECPTDGP